MSVAKLNIASVLVGDSKQDFRLRTPDAQDANARLDLLVACVHQAVTAGCRVVVLPAGFFVVASCAERDALEQVCLAQLAGEPILVAFGIDVRPAKKGGARKGDVEETPGDKFSVGKASAASEQAGYDLFGYVVEAGQFLISRIAQTGITTEEVQRTISDAECDARCKSSRLLGGAKVALLLCGEVRSEAWHTAMGTRAPDLVLHLAHASVPLGGTSNESWTTRVDGLMQELPGTAVWAFADHLRAMGHWDSASGLVPLVRRVCGASVPQVSADPVAHEIPATMYVYAAA